MRHLAFIGVVRASVACGDAAPAPNAPAPASLPAEASPNASPSASASPFDKSDKKKRRRRTGKAVPTTHDGTKPKNGRPLNPKDPSGRTVFVREDDHCFIEIPDSTETVDCPPPADDPAFDHCTAQIVLDGAGDRCFCVSGAGNPRPMPRPTPCPSQK